MTRPPDRSFASSLVCLLVRYISNGTRMYYDHSERMYYDGIATSLEASLTRLLLGVADNRVRLYGEHRR